MFLRSDQDLFGGGGAASLRAPRGLVAPALDVRERIAAIDWTPDLGSRIGSLDWFRGAATCLALCWLSWQLGPGIGDPVIGAAPAALAGSDWDEARAQGIAPLAWGASTGRHEAAGDLVAPLGATPERPIIELTATVGAGDDLASVLQRAGVGRSDAARAGDLVAGALGSTEVMPGTRIALTLGRRATRSVPRPLEKLDFRARFDLALGLARAGGVLTLQRTPIAVDHTPLRVRGLVGSSLYRSARAAGVPARIVERYIKAIATKVSIGGDVAAADTFDIIVDRARAATGEEQLGQLQFAGLDQGRKKVQLVRWTEDGRDQWFDARGTGERRGGMMFPVAGHITSPFGARRHPILGYLRMHKGLDIGAPYGSPIHAASDGVVVFSGRNAGYGNFVKLRHGGGLQTAYGHMSRIAVSAGTHVTAGQVIGYVGSTGLSTGPHVHYEVLRNGVAVNPKTVSFSSIAQLSGDALRGFKSKVAALLAVQPGAAR